MREAAAQSLGHLGHTDEAAEVLQALISSPTSEAAVRRDAILALVQVRRTHEVLNHLLALLRAPTLETVVRCATAEAVSLLGQTNDQLLSRCA